MLQTQASLGIIDDDLELFKEELLHDKNELADLRRENKELLTTIQKNASTAHHTAKDDHTTAKIKAIGQKIFNLHRQLDLLKHENNDTETLLTRMYERAKDFIQDGSPAVKPDDPLAQTIRTLENRLDNSLIKRNEAVDIRNTYALILKRMRQEQISFDNQLLAVQNTVKANEKDDWQLQNMSHDAQYARDMAKQELEDLKKSAEKERKEKRRLLEKKKTFVSDTLEQAQNQERAEKAKQELLDEERRAKGAAKKAEEQEKNRLRDSVAERRTVEMNSRLQESINNYKKIKELIHVSCEQEVIMRWYELNDNAEQLFEKKQKAETIIETLKKKRDELKAKLDNAKYSGHSKLDTRHIIDEFERHLKEAQQSLQRTKDSCEEATALHAGVKTGVEHLTLKLSTYDPESVTPPIIDEKGYENLLPAVDGCGEKLKKLADEVSAKCGTSTVHPPSEPSSPTTGMISGLARQLERMEGVEIPPYNLRIVEQIDELVLEPKSKRSVSEDTDDNVEEDPHTRLDLKQLSTNTVERESKKEEKKRKGPP